MAELPLAGIRVLDFTWVVAGPVATRILADYGAEVIRFERPGSAALGPRQTGLQGEIHRNKLSVAINMNQPEAIEIARKLAATSDVVIDNFAPRVMSNWGLDYDNLKKVKPDIICVSMSGFGHTGPRSGFVSYGPTLQALTGFTLLMADTDGTPAGWGFSYSDTVGGFAGALGALLALWYRKRTGQGQFVDLSQLEASASLIGPMLLDITVNRRNPKPAFYESQEMPAAPHGVYRCRALGDDGDRWVAIAIRSQAEWQRFVAAIGSPSWADDAKFRTLYLRMHNRAELDAHVSQWTAARDATEVMMLLQSAQVAAGVVANGADLCVRDQHLKERGFWVPVTTVEGKTTCLKGLPNKLSHTPGSVRSTAPLESSSLDYVLGDVLGYTRAERDRLLAEKVVWPTSI